MIQKLQSRTSPELICYSSIVDNKKQFKSSRRDEIDEKLLILDLMRSCLYQQNPI
jgi:hypothetical protein